MVFRLLKRIKTLPFRLLNRNKTVASVGALGDAANDSRLPPQTSVFDQVRYCERCEHFAGIFPVRLQDQLNYGEFGGCVHAKVNKIVMGHDNCAFWEKSRLRPKQATQ